MVVRSIPFLTIKGAIMMRMNRVEETLKIEELSNEELFEIVSERSVDEVYNLVMSDGINEGIL